MLDDTPGSQGPITEQTRLTRWALVRAAVLGVLLAVFTSVVLLVDFLPSNQVLLNEGDVSPADILAPYDLAYRADGYAPLEQKADWIATIPDLSLSPDVISQTLTLNEDDWQAAKDETVRVLIRAMQGEIRDNQVATVRRRVPTLISIDMTDDQAAVVEAVAGGLVTANTLYNAARTEEAKQQARDQTEPVKVTVRKGEAIVRQGSLVRNLDIEALDAFGLRQQEIRWQVVVAMSALAIVTTVLLELLIFRLRPTLWAQSRAAITTFVLIAIFVALGKLMLPLSDSIVPYLYPLPALSMILSILFGPALGMAVGVIVGLLGGYMSGGSSEIVAYLLAGTLMGAMSLGQAERLKTFLRAALSVALVNAAIILLFGLLRPEQDMLRVSINSLVGLVSGGMATSLALAAFFVLSAMLDVITPFQLMELSRPTHPLFRQLLLKAPGTYHHTLLVANMAEEAAEQIGADGLLTRVGTYYHDIGKTLRPYFFTENRVGHVNPHERLDPYTSAQIILSHVPDGLDLAEKYHLPSAIRAFIPEHHGTGMTLAFYRMAVKADDDDGHGVRKEDFSYPGPKPQTRETAITMLADGCEARVRSAEPGSVEEIERIIADTVKARLDDGQLDESNLTLRYIKEIQAAFLSVLKGVFHPRVKYPEPVKVKGADGREVEI
jgi:putative nucleotidyltransferase with HDIG domain